MACSTEEQLATISKSGSASSSLLKLSRNSVWSSNSNRRMSFILVLIARFGDDRQRNCKTAARRARDMHQISPESANQGARNIEPEAGGFGASLKRLEQPLRRGNAGSRVLHAHQHAAPCEGCGDGENLRGRRFHRAGAVLGQIE